MSFRIRQPSVEELPVIDKIVLGKHAVFQCNALISALTHDAVGRNLIDFVKQLLPRFFQFQRIDFRNVLRCKITIALRFSMFSGFFG